MAIKNVIEESIISALNMDELPLADKAALMDKIVEVVNKSVLLRIGQNLSDEDRKRFTQIVDSGSDDELNDFLNKYQPDFLDIVMEETARLKESMVEHLNK